MSANDTLLQSPTNSKERRENHDRNFEADLPSSSYHSTQLPVSALSHSPSLESELENTLNIDGPPRFPEKGDFPSSVTVGLLEPDVDAEAHHCVVLLHSYGSNEKALRNVARKLQKNQKDSAFILLRGITPVQGDEDCYHWADQDGAINEGFLAASWLILSTVIKDTLIAKCHFRPREILILGKTQGGMAALAAAAAWGKIELEGVVSLGGPLPAYSQLPDIIKARTPALILGGALGNVTATALQQIQDNFTYVDSDLQPRVDDEIPEAAVIERLRAFFAHRLGREEWKKQAIISFGMLFHILDYRMLIQ